MGWDGASPCNACSYPNAEVPGVICHQHLDLCSQVAGDDERKLVMMNGAPTSARPTTYPWPIDRRPTPNGRLACPGLVRGGGSASIPHLDSRADGKMRGSDPCSSRQVSQKRGRGNLEIVVARSKRNSRQPGWAFPARRHHGAFQLTGA